MKNISLNIERQFDEIVSYIHTTHNKVLKVANSALIDLYWQIGGYISKQLSDATWGDSVVSQLAAFIQLNVPNSKGFSDKNLWRMRQFYDT